MGTSLRGVHYSILLFATIVISKSFGWNNRIFLPHKLRTMLKNMEPFLLSKDFQCPESLLWIVYFHCGIVKTPGRAFTRRGATLLYGSIGQDCVWREPPKQGSCALLCSPARRKSQGPESRTGSPERHHDRETNSHEISTQFPQSA